MCDHDLHDRPGVGPEASLSGGRPAYQSLIRIAREIVVPRVSTRKGRRRVVVEDEGLSAQAREVDQQVGALRRTEQQVEWAVRIGRVGSQQRTWDAIGVLGHLRQEAAFTADLV